MIAREPNRRNKLVIRLLYAAGLRVSELCGLRWRHLQERGATGQLSVFRSRKGKPLSRAQVFRIVKTAVKRAELGD